MGKERGSKREKTQGTGRGAVKSSGALAECTSLA